MHLVNTAWLYAFGLFVANHTHMHLVNAVLTVCIWALCHEPNACRYCSCKDTHMHLENMVLAVCIWELYHLPNANGVNWWKDIHVHLVKHAFTICREAPNAFRQSPKKLHMVTPQIHLNFVCIWGLTYIQFSTFFQCVSFFEIWDSNLRINSTYSPLTWA